MKTCTKCGCEKPTSAFLFKPGMADGRASKCRVCLIAEDKARRDAKKVVVPMRTGTNPFDVDNYRTRFHSVPDRRYT